MYCSTKVESVQNLMGWIRQPISLSIILYNLTSKTAKLLVRV